MTPIVFSAWMGPGEMSVNREKALLSIIKNNGCLNVHVTAETLPNWVHPNYPLHKSFNFLSAVHKCDYLRCYLLHIYGGGYTDVKPTTKNWRYFFSLLSKSGCDGLGYTEIGPSGVAAVGGELEQEMKKNYQKLIGVCAMIFKPDSEFTRKWYQNLITLLDKHAHDLQLNPAKHPQDHIGAKFSDGTISRYPLRWTEVGGDIFHPLAYAYASRIIHYDIAPNFQNYR